jgi:hypothetical protein
LKKPHCISTVNTAELFKVPTFVLFWKQLLPRKNRFIFVLFPQMENKSFRRKSRGSRFESLRVVRCVGSCRRNAAHSLKMCIVPSVSFWIISVSLGLNPETLGPILRSPGPRHSPLHTICDWRNKQRVFFQGPTSSRGATSSVLANFVTLGQSSPLGLIFHP